MATSTERHPSYGQNRYVIRYSVLSRSFKIIDRDIQAYCGLPPTSGGPSRELEFPDRMNAVEWLDRCYLRWGQIPKVGYEAPEYLDELPPRPYTAPARLSSGAVDPYTGKLISAPTRPYRSRS